MACHQTTFTFIVLCCVGLLSGQLLPDSFCVALRYAFRAIGCVEQGQQKFKNPLCEIWAVTFTFGLAGKELCKYRPCVGYYEPPNRSCRATLNCPVSSIEINGICSGSNVCCNLAPNVAFDAFVNGTEPVGNIDGSDATTLNVTNLSN